ncbi:hypothetical protein [Actinomadura sp. 21ATH]|uniref:hypothetical protein n=1 Tax=Actinomadura sp. 21ATH TaxID=1735444 RepID=UPI0035BECDB4
MVQEPRRGIAGLGRAAAPHLFFLPVLAVAVAVRVIAVRGYPAPWWFGDSAGYLKVAIELGPGDLRPSGYPFLLWLLKPFHSFTVVVAVQHAIGVLTGVLVYLLVWRAGQAAWRRRPPGRIAWRRWLPGLIAAAATVPVLIPVHQIALEHMLMSDFLFTFLLLLAMTVILWRERMTWWTGGLAGLVMASAALTRSAGLPLILVLLVGMLLRRAGWRACVSAAGVYAVAILAYMAWFNSVYGQFTVAKASQIWLYGRTADFADCRIIKPSPELAIMCPKQTNPAISPAFSSMWTDDSAFRNIPGWVTGPHADKLAGEFAWKAIMAQPGDYAAVIVRDTFRSFEWERKPYPTPWTWHQYEFSKGEEWADDDALLAERYDPAGSGRPRVVEPHASRVLAYQDHAAMPGTFLGYMMLAGLAGLVRNLRHLGRWRVGGGLLHWLRTVLLPGSLGLALLVIPAATADFDYRYVVPAVPFAIVAAALALLPRPYEPETGTEPGDGAAAGARAEPGPGTERGTDGSGTAGDGPDQPPAEPAENDENDEVDETDGADAREPESASPVTADSGQRSAHRT